MLTDLAWDLPGQSPEVIIVEKAEASAVEDWITNSGTTGELDALFAEVARLDVSLQNYTYAWSGSYSSKAFRLKSANSEGVSAPGELVIVELDTDADGLPDWWESLFGGLDPGLDGDGDGLSNLGEFTAGTDPNSADTDGDGLADGADSAPLQFNSNSLNFLVHTLLN